MAGSLNNVILEAAVGNDPILRKTKNDTSVLNFSGACHYSRDKEREPVWIAFRCWNKLADAMADLLKKGKQVFVSGTIPLLQSPHKLATRNGAEAYFTKEAQATIVKILAEVRKGEKAWSRNDTKIIETIQNMVSTQVVVDVDTLRLGADPKSQSTESEIDIDVDGDDEIPF